MIISAIALLLPAPVLAISPLQGQMAAATVTSGAGDTAHQADGGAAANSGLSVQRICQTGGPSMFSGRARRENCELKVVQPQCKSTAPAMFSGRARSSSACVVEMKEPTTPSHAPSIFSGRAPRPASAYAPPAYTYVVAQDGTAKPAVTYRTVEEARKVRVPSRLPSMFTGRRRKPAQ